MSKRKTKYKWTKKKHTADQLKQLRQIGMQYAGYTKMESTQKTKVSMLAQDNNDQSKSRNTLFDVSVMRKTMRATKYAKRTT